jgi:GTP cyclohydrolase III
MKVYRVQAEVALQVTAETPKEAREKAQEILNSRQGHQVPLVVGAVYWGEEEDF